MAENVRREQARASIVQVHDPEYTDNLVWKIEVVYEELLFSDSKKSNIFIGGVEETVQAEENIAGSGSDDRSEIDGVILLDAMK